jgi:hypothetical protein
MNRLAILIGAAMICGTAAAQGVNWVQLFADKNETTYYLADNKISYHKNNMVTFIIRGAFSKPMPIEVAGKQHVGVGALMQVVGSCTNFTARIIRDQHLAVDGSSFAENAMAASDTVSKVVETSPIGGALRVVCKPRGLEAGL